MNYLAIALVIIIIVIIYSFFTYLTNNALVAGLQPLNTPMTWTFDKLLNTTALSYSYQCWLFITENPVGTQKIFYRGDTTTDTQFEVSLDSNLNLMIGSKLKDGTTSQTIMNVMSGFPLQKWVYLAINVNQKNVEAYINGKLVKTVNAPNMVNPTMRAGLTIGNSNLQGYLSKFYRLPETLDAQKIQTNYLSGNGLNNWFSSVFPYGMNLTITSAESASRVINVF